jgi:hypothetical protein
MWSIFLYWFTKVVVVLFFVGLVGSIIVVIITFIEDIQVLFEKDESPSTKEVDRSH